MKILVIGGTGFVGEHVCNQLVKAGDSVIAIHNSGLTNRILGVEYKQINLDQDTQGFEQILNEIEVVVFSIQPDIERMKKMIDVLSRQHHLKKIVYLSSVLVYGDSDDKQDEEAIPQPSTEYEQKKFEEEQLLSHALQNREDVVLSIVRLGNVYGDVKNKGIMHYIIKSLIIDGIFTINGDGSAVRDYVFVDDVGASVKDIVHMKQEKQTEIVNICTGVGTTILELIAYAEHAADKKLDFKKGSPVDEKHSVIGDNQKLKMMVGRGPEIQIQEGINKMYQRYIDKK